MKSYGFMHTTIRNTALRSYKMNIQPGSSCNINSRFSFDTIRNLILASAHLVEGRFGYNYFEVKQNAECIVNHN